MVSEDRMVVAAVGMEEVHKVPEDSHLNLDDDNKHSCFNIT